jgi:hypothetical protein
MGLNLATAAMLAQDASTQLFLRALYDQAAQLLTLSTATAAIFIGLSDKNTFRGWRLYLGLVPLVPLVISAVSAVLMMSWITMLMGESGNYSYSTLYDKGSFFSTDGLLLLRRFHLLSLFGLAVGVVLFIIIKIFSAPAETDTAETKRIKLVDDQGKVHVIVSVSHEEQVRAARSERVSWWRRMFGG